MRLKIPKIPLGGVSKVMKPFKNDPSLISRYSTSRLLLMTIEMARITVISFWRNHRLASRVIATGLALLMLVSIFIQVYQPRKAEQYYDISATTGLLREPIALYGDELKFNEQTRVYEFNKGYTAQPGEVGGDSYAPKINASFAGSPENTVSVTDPVNEVTMSLRPLFPVMNPKKDQNRVIYPILGTDAKKVYSLYASGVKEDIIFTQRPSRDSMRLEYELSLPDGLEARLENNGSIGVYGVSSTLLGNISTASEADAELLQKARKNGEKTEHLFTIPTPVVVEPNKKISNATAKFELEGDKLALQIDKLHSADYPLSVDPTVYVETARKLMRGNNETNIDFDVPNELIQKSQTTGARINSWTSTTNLTSAVYGQGTAVAGGYIYSVGGIGSSTVVTTSYNTAGTHNYVVPTGVTSVSIKAWGAGGAGGAGDGSSAGGNGGGGGHARATIDVTPAETLTVNVGTGGSDIATNSLAGSGGGATTVLRSSTELVKAGGGGGGGGTRGTRTGGAGGAGGGDTGIGGSTPTGGGGGGGGGTSQAGGTAGATDTGGTAGSVGALDGGGRGAGYASATCATAVTNTQGGAGGTGNGGAGGLDTTSCSNGGGGGGGYYGGGGGGSTSDNNRGGGGGGGGSAYVNPTGLLAGTDVLNAGSGTTPGSSADSDRQSLADGGTGATSASGNTAGEGGIVVISYNTPGTISASLYWAQFNSSTNAIESPNPGPGVCSGWCTNSAYDLPVALTGLSFVAYNGFLFAIGGSNSSGTPQSTVYIAKLGANGEPQLWHPTGGTAAYWYTDTALSSARSQFAMVAYNNRIYLLGGLSASSTVLASNTVQYADIRPNGTLTSFTSTGMQALTTARYGVTAHIYNDTIYVLGGNATFAGTPVTTVEYSKLNSDGTMNSWNTASTMLTAGRMTGGGSFSTIFGGYIYINGGCSVVNASGYCTTIATDVQLASINADGSLAPWNTVLGLTNDRFSHTMIAWQGGLYRLGGCRVQDASTGDCTDAVLSVDYGVINVPGEASTVATSVSNSNSPCNSPDDPYNCNLPTSSVGNMLNASVVLNGYLYIMGGCTNNACTTRSSGVTYQSMASDGSLQRPSNCTGTYTDSYCVSSSSLPTALGAPGVAIFNGTIYIVGGFPSIDNIYYVSVSSDGSLGTWQNNNTVTGTTTTADDLSYTYAYARANPGSAGSNPGNMFIIGGCSGDTSGIGCSSYSSAVSKCNITTSGSITSCSTASQLQIGTVTGNDGDPTGGGLGAHAGAVYANYIYLMGGLSASAPSTSNGTDLTFVRYARFDDSNNIVAVSGSDWVEGPNEMVTGRRRGAGFGYNGYLYVLGGYDGADAIADIEFAKINVSDGSWGVFSQSSVSIQKRWGLTTVVSNSYAYVIGGCTAGAAPSSCSTRTDTIQTFQVYNNDSGAPVGYVSSDNLFATDRYGASSVIHNSYLYIAGGCTDSTESCSLVTDSVQYAPLDAEGDVGTWSAAADLPMAPGSELAFGQLEEAGGTLYWIGGQTSGGTESAAVYYGTPNVSTGNIASWGTVSTSYDLPAERSQFGAASWNDRIYVVAGINASNAVTNTVYISPDQSGGGDIVSAWSTGGTSPDISRSGNTVVAYANNLYSFGGYDGTNYLLDSQYTQIESNGSVTDAWIFTTPLPNAVRQGDGFAANGYIYVVGGRSTGTNCSSRTYVAPISANTTIASGNNPTGIGEWNETNQRYNGKRYANTVSYHQGRVYVLGGICESSFPNVESIHKSTIAFDNNAHQIRMPTQVGNGDLLLVIISTDGGSGVNVPTGWTAIVTATSAGNRGGVYAKIADGSEAGDYVNFSSGGSGSETASAHTYRILANDWYGDLAGVEVGTSVTGSTATPNPPSLNPGAWGTENTLWIAYSAGSSYNIVTAYPTNHTSGTHNRGGTTIDDASMTSAHRKSAAASEDPGSFTMNSSQNHVTNTIAIRPLGGTAALTGSYSVSYSTLLSQPMLAKYSRMIDTDTDVFPNSWLLNGLDNSIGARWQVKYRSMHDLDTAVNPNEDCGTSSTMAQMTTWGQETDFGDTMLGDVNTYIPVNSSGGDIECARYYFFFVEIDAEHTFGYPEDVTRGPTISDLSLFFTADPSKRLRHGKTFTGGEQQPLDTPCRTNIDADCPLAP